MSKKTVGFYKLISDEDNRSMIGALLVTDNTGKPEEFRVTHPVKPSLVQRQLYGKSLLPHVGMELCGLPLIEALTRDPDLLIVSHEEFLGLGDAFNLPIVYLERAGTSLTVADPTPAGRPTKTCFEAPLKQYEPIHVTFPPTYKEDRRAQATEAISEFFQQIDLTEPLQRIDVAVRILREQDETFR